MHFSDASPLPLQVYLVQMDRPGLTDANYCDANTSPSHWCTEIDITEGNVAGYQSALHTKQGHADGNVCDADGCYAKPVSYTHLTLPTKA